MKMTEFGAYSGDLCHSEKLWPLSTTEEGHKEYPTPEETYKQTIYFNLSDWAFESICLVSDDDKAGGKHCTIWAVTACDFTSERELLYSPAKSNGVYSSPATDQPDCVEHTDVDEFKTKVTNLIYLDMQTSFYLTKSLLSTQTVFATCCSSSSRQLLKKIASHHSLIS